MVIAFNLLIVWCVSALVPPLLKLSVDTLQFLLFLYTQQLNRVSLRTSLIGEEWPSLRSRSPSPSDRSPSSSDRSQNKVKT